MTYGKITQITYEDMHKNKFDRKVENNFSDDTSFGHETKGLYMCYPMFNEEKEEEAESCVYLELSLEV